MLRALVLTGPKVIVGCSECGSWEYDRAEGACESCGGTDHVVQRDGGDVTCAACITRHSDGISHGNVCDGAYSSPHGCPKGPVVLSAIGWTGHESAAGAAAWAKAFGGEAFTWEAAVVVDKEISAVIADYPVEGERRCGDCNCEGYCIVFTEDGNVYDPDVEARCLSCCVDNMRTNGVIPSREGKPVASVIRAVEAALQPLEELGGPSMGGYLATLERVAQIATERAAAARALAGRRI